jgi:hypothetical protein
MQSIAVIKHGYVIQHILLRFESSLVIPPMDSFLLQAPEEAFRNRIIPAITLATHAPDKAMGFQ